MVAFEAFIVDCIKNYFRNDVPYGMFPGEIPGEREILLLDDEDKIIKLKIEFKVEYTNNSAFVLFRKWIINSDERILREKIKLVEFFSQDNINVHYENEISQNF